MNESLPKISIIVPVYNVENFLGKCIDSLISQIYSNIEILLIDDGSNDNSGKIAEDYAKKDARIIVLHKINGGLSDARNAGIKIASGEFICFVDSDDFVSPDYVSHLYQLMNQYNADIVQCDYLKFYDRNDDVQTIDDIETVRELSNIDAIGEFYKYSGIDVIAWNKLYKKELFSKIEFPKGKIHEDVFTVYKLLFLAKKIVHTTNHLYFYRQREGSIIHVFNEKRLDILQAFLEIDEFYRKNGLRIYIPLNLKKELNVIMRLYSETKNKIIKRKLKHEFNQCLKKYWKETKGINLFLFRYIIFLFFPFIDSFFIKIVDRSRNE